MKIQSLRRKLTLTKKVTLYGFMMGVFVLVGCGDDPVPVAAPEASFTQEINGKQATFTNTTEGEVDSQVWDFGDGETSTEPSPTHTYAANGTYVVKLIATNATDSDESSAVLEIINIAIDGDLSDWDDVPALVENSAEVGGFLTKLKVENLENNKLFIYVETNEEMLTLDPDAGTVIQILLDTDNDLTTGAGVCWYWYPGSEDFLFEGTFLGAEATFVVKSDNGDGEGACGGWYWEDLSYSIDDYMVASDLQTISGGFAYELSIDLSALPTTVGGAGVSSEAIGIGVHHNETWGENSFIPQKYTEPETEEDECPTCGLAIYPLK